MKKKISVVIPTYNEEGNVKPLAEAIVTVMETELPQYRYEILFIDNHSKDRTRMYLRELCAKNKNIKAIFNARNFGQLRSPVYGLKQATGDCVVRMCADFQDPVDMIVKFVREWEKGSKIVIGIKKASKENRMMYWIRGCYYKLIRKITDIDHIEQFTGFGTIKHLWMWCGIFMIRCRICGESLQNSVLTIRRFPMSSRREKRERVKIISTVYMIMR